MAIIEGGFWPQEEFGRAGEALPLIPLLDWKTVFQFHRFPALRKRHIVRIRPIGRSQESGRVSHVAGERR